MPIPEQASTGGCGVADYEGVPQNGTGCYSQAFVRRMAEGVYDLRDRPSAIAVRAAVREMSQSQAGESPHIATSLPISCRHSRQLSWGQLDCLALLLFSIEHFDRSLGNRSFNSLAAFRARSRVSNSFLVWPSTTRANPLVGRSTRTLEVGKGGRVSAAVLIRCVRCWRMVTPMLGINLLNE